MTFSIFGGWFLEWVCTVLIYMLATMLRKFLAENYTQNRLLQQQNHNAEKQLIMQTNYTFQLREQVEIRRRVVHDRTISAHCTRWQNKPAIR